VKEWYTNMHSKTVGMHGKIPAQGDFVSRDLPLQFTTGWDQWMQQCLLASQHTLGTQWLDAYLASPVWRFAMTAGVLGDQTWAGVMIPSVDRSGRYYPLMLASACGMALPTQIMAQAGPWFIELEQTALGALDAGVTLPVVEAQLSQLPAMALKPVPSSQEKPVHGSWEIGRPLALPLQQAQQNPLNAYPVLLHELLQQRLSCYSLWWSSGSSRLAPAQLIAGYLPSAQCYTSFLAGDWNANGWSTPFSEVEQWF